MARTTTRATGSSAETVNVIHSDADYLVLVPEPPETWTVVDEDIPIRRERTERWRYSGVIELVSRGPQVADPNVYRVDEWCWAYLQDVLEHRETMCPCGHSGLINHGSHYECGFDLCDRVFEREEINA